MTTTSEPIKLRTTASTSFLAGKKPILTPRKLGNLLGLTLTQAKLLTSCLKKANLYRPFYADTYEDGTQVLGLWSGAVYSVRFQKGRFRFRVTHDGHVGTGWYGPCYIEARCTDGCTDDGPALADFRIDFPDVKTLLEFLNEILQWDCIVE